MRNDVVGCSPSRPFFDRFGIPWFILGIFWVSEERIEKSEEALKGGKFTREEAFVSG
jgi:hypothetical protein